MNIHVDLSLMIKEVVKKINKWNKDKVVLYY